MTACSICDLRARRPGPGGTTLREAIDDDLFAGVAPVFACEKAGLDPREWVPLIEQHVAACMPEEERRAVQEARELRNGPARERRAPRSERAVRRVGGG